MRVIRWRSDEVTNQQIGRSACFQINQMLIHPRLVGTDSKSRTKEDKISSQKPKSSTNLLFPPPYPNKIRWQAPLLSRTSQDFKVEQMHSWLSPSTTFFFINLQDQHQLCLHLLWIVLCRISILYLPSKGCIFFENGAGLPSCNKQIMRCHLVVTYQCKTSFICNIFFLLQKNCVMTEKRKRDQDQDRFLFSLGQIAVIQWAFLVSSNKISNNINPSVKPNFPI